MAVGSVGSVGSVVPVGSKPTTTVDGHYFFEMSLESWGAVYFERTGR